MTITICRPYPVNVRFSRKPTSLRAMLREHGGYYIEEQRIRVISIKTMTAAEYDAYVRDLTSAQDWIVGFKGNGDQCIVVRAPARIDLYIRPEGYDYARYAGFTDAD
ncbi:hypothetical protein [Lysobacter sp. CA199]|uniref:hypothetical protein n=1 Tax=Lysobacter sp. CA199 TaxID=3455608 RepID=UPI003F8D6186